MRAPSRRRMLVVAAASAAGLLAPSRVRARPLQRLIWVINQRDEEFAATYRREDGHYDFHALARLQHLFRDIRENLPGPLPPQLIDLLAILQESFGFDRPLRLHSGYRTPRTNASIGEGASPRSFHLHGMAADISMRGVSPLDLALAAHAISLRLGIMGVGLYGHFVHVDIGPVARWTRIGRS
ncbi:YcbK family protein [Caldovatus aquaticus]|uniref:Murein endopeptidase K n=1 Tax=Caldovatus aquaticus TaxID=2865671 RepID=A0ABS7EYN2_9PROT|nr:DUF882 domain-containing protein [Caldovatus aquaticus]MBW8268475.1 DUF882 domain-containing protein [Caldovatus aquaticus]